MRPSTEAKRKQRRIEKARKAGLATFAKYGPEHYSVLGKMGGRPTFEESIARAKAREAEAKSKSRGPGRPHLSPPEG